MLTNRNFEPEFEFLTSRSSGPGGQNVNKVNTKVELRFQVFKSENLNEEEKITISEKLKNKINTEGFLVITCQTERSQLRNKELVIEKFFQILEKALHKPKKRRATKVPKSVKEKRLKTKKITSERKSSRKKTTDE
jgi:ribosome-associated protein